MAELPDLPVVEALSALRRALGEQGRAVLAAPPGSGKTTLVPLVLLDEPWLAGRRILMLEPRRLATRAAASRMAELLGEAVGETVGYAMRFERRLSARSRIEVVTEGLLLRRLQADPGLEGIGLVVFDEFHERSLDVDLGLALVREVQASLRPDLKVLVMSATLDAEAVAGYLDGAPIVRAEGRQHLVAIHHRPGEEPAGVVRDVLRRHRGDVLVFLPGAFEIERLAGLLEPANAEVHRLYGALPKAAQDRALRPSPGRRKVVLATNIAETSLTIEGVEVVVDTGLQRRSRYSPRTGMSRLETVRISRASADQRAGRAGRLGPGHAYRLWAEAETRGLAPADPPEIQEADLTALVLELALWGVRDPAGLAFLTPPPAGGFAAAKALLEALGALDEAGAPTPHGRRIATMPLHPRLAHMVVAAGAHGATSTALALAAMASEGGGWGRHLGADLADRLAAWREAPAGVGRIHRELCRQLKLAPEPPDPAEAGLCAALAFPDRIAQRRQPGSAELRLASGRGARLGDATAFADADFVVVWESEDRGSDAMVRLAAGLDRAVLERLAAERIHEEEVRFDAASGRVVGASRRMLGALLLAQREMRPTAAAVQACLLEAIGRHGIALLPWTGRLLALRQRLCWLHKKLPDEWPAFDEVTLEATAEAWLAPWLAGVRGLGELTEPLLERALGTRLDGQHAAALDRLAPAAWTAPLGTALPIDYGQDPPTVACRLQALLGLDRHPTILDGRQPLSLQLLSPAGRPIQVTMDLPGFWRGSYALVRKDLSGRYPKHPWPEDPLEASPWRPGMGRVR